MNQSAGEHDKREAANPTTAPPWDAVKRFSNHPLVANVGASDLNGQGNTTRVGKHMALDGILGAHC